MDKDGAIIILAGVGMLFGILGFFAYLLAQGKTQIQGTITYPYMIPAKSAETPVIKTEEIRPTRPHIINHTLMQANAWYEIPIPTDISTWSMNARGTYDILYSFEPSHSTYRTLFQGTFLDSDTMPHGVTPTAIYVSSDTAGAVVEMALFR